MLKISNKQLDDALELEWAELGQRIEQRWPTISRRLYPGYSVLPELHVRNWVAQAITACREQGIDNEEAVICLATDVLSAATMRLPKSFIVDMSRYFLASAADESDCTMAQEWINWILFEQYGLQRARGVM